MGILNYSTKIAARKSANECQDALAKHGATRVAVMYDGGTPTAIAFAIFTEFGVRQFELAANSPGVDKAMRSDPTIPKHYHSAEQADRVAWRILKDWITAQLAIIEAGITTLDEVMLPYMLTNSGRTLSQEYRSSAGMRAAIEAPHPERES